MARKSETLEQGLDRSASKKGYTGKERHRYIGGAIRNMEKRGEVKIHPRTSRRAPAHTPPSPRTRKTTAAPAPAPAPKKQSYERPSITKREKLELVVKKNVAASEKVPQHAYDLYSVYNKKTGALHDSATYRKRPAATAAAKRDMEAHNHPHGPHAQNRLA